MAMKAAKNLGGVPWRFDCVSLIQFEFEAQAPSKTIKGFTKHALGQMLPKCTWTVAN